MNLRELRESAPAKYWTPPKDRHIELDILSNPDKYSESYVATYKMDGEWSRWTKDNDGNWLVQSRSISKVTGTYGDKTELVPHLIAALDPYIPKNTCILGEICFWDLSCHSNDVSAILRCKPKKALERQKDKPLHLYIFDVLMYDDQDLTNKPYYKRAKVRDEIRIPFAELQKFEPNNPMYIHCAVDMSIQEVADKYNDYIACGGEGFVLKRLDSVYKPGTRTAWDSIKLKRALDDLVLPVVDTIEPERVHKGEEPGWAFIDDDGTEVTKYYYYGWKAGVIVDFNGVLIRVSSGVTDQMAQYLASDEAKEKIKDGKITAKVSAMSITADGSLRHPVLASLSICN